MGFIYQLIQALYHAFSYSPASPLPYLITLVTQQHVVRVSLAAADAASCVQR